MLVSTTVVTTEEVPTEGPKGELLAVMVGVFYYRDIKGHISTEITPPFGVGMQPEVTVTVTTPEREAARVRTVVTRIFV